MKTSGRAADNLKCQLREARIRGESRTTTQSGVFCQVSKKIWAKAIKTTEVTVCSKQIDSSKLLAHSSDLSIKDKIASRVSNHRHRAEMGPELITGRKDTDSWTLQQPLYESQSHFK